MLTITADVSRTGCLEQAANNVAKTTKLKPTVRIIRLYISVRPSAIGIDPNKVLCPTLRGVSRRAALSLSNLTQHFIHPGRHQGTCRTKPGLVEQSAPRRGLQVEFECMRAIGARRLHKACRWINPTRCTD